MNELGNTPADKDYQPSGIVNDIVEGQIKAVQLPDGKFVTQSLFDRHKKQVLEMFLSWEDIKTIEQIIATSDWYDLEINGKLWSKEFYEEVLKRFKEAKK